MKLLLYSSVFPPSVGGVETISLTLAKNMADCGVAVHVVTETPAEPGFDRDFPFPVTRKPGFAERLRLVRAAELVFSNGSSIALFFHAKLAGKPFVWTHNGYQLLCLDGLGWVDGVPSPMSPMASIAFHARRRSAFRTLVPAAKLFLRRIAARFVDLNIAATGWVARRQPLRNQVVLYTPYALGPFKARDVGPSPEFDLIYVGRLVSEKGVAVLLRAFRRLIDEKGHGARRLLIVGDGQWRPMLEQCADELQLQRNVTFAGKQTGEALFASMSKAPIAVVPSEWEEPMGGVALEHLAGGKAVIVAADGGMAECIGDAGLTFRNGDADALFDCMKRLLEDDALRARLRRRSRAQADKFDDMALTKRYVETFEAIVREDRTQPGTA